MHIQMAMDRNTLIESVLGSPAKIRVLKVLLTPGAGHMSINQLARVTGLNSVSLARALRSIKKTGLADYIPAGKSQLWRIVDGYTAHVIRPLFKAMDETRDPEDELKRLLKKNPPPHSIDKITLFGSLATQSALPESDIDLFFLIRRKKQFKALSEYCDKLTETISQFFGMAPSFLIKTPAEWEKTDKSLRSNIEKGIILYEKNKNH